MRVIETKALARERGLRGYSRLRKAELIALLQNNPPAPRARPSWPTRRPPPLPPSVRQPSPQEMNIFKQQMSKSRLVVTSKLNDWYD